MTKAQLQMLKDIARDGEPTDYADFHDRAGAALGWRNRERVLDALVRKGMLDNELRVTPAGAAELGRQQ